MDIKVPQCYNDGPHLAKWVSTQCSAYKNKMMAEESRHLLDSIVFVWDGSAPGTSTATWEEMYQRLVAYKKKHKNNIIPSRYKEDPKLWIWVHNQHAAYRSKLITRSKLLTKERKRLLNSTGVV